MQEHEFLVYLEGTYPKDYLESYYNLADHVTDDPQQLDLKASGNTEKLQKYDEIADSLEEEAAKLVLDALDYLANLRERRPFSVTGPRHWRENEKERFASWWEMRRRLQTVIGTLSCWTREIEIAGESLAAARG